MDIQTLLILLMIGVVAGMLSGVVGIGGGIIIVPALIWFLGFDQRTAQGTSLAILLLPVGLLGVWQFYKGGYVNVPFALVIAASFFAGSYFGSRIALTVSQDVLRKVFAVILLLVAVKMLLPEKHPRDTASTDAPGKNSAG